MVVLVRLHFGLLAGTVSTWQPRDGVDLGTVSLARCSRSIRPAPPSACDVMPARRWLPRRIAAAALDRLPSRSVYWYFVRRDGVPSWSGIAARIGQQ
jgi:hypothetical protein